MGTLTPSMSAKRILKQVVPSPVRRLGWRGYYYIRGNWLKSIVGCRTPQKIVALTFDDGPDPVSTLPILDLLAHYQVKATFFLIGRNVASNPQSARSIAQAKHAIGNHTFTHLRLVGHSPVLVMRELLQCHRAIREATGIAPKVMRPPFGAQDPTAYLTARIMGYSIVTWSASGDDWKGDPAAAIAERILADVRTGGIILLHDGLEPPPDQAEWRPEHNLLKDRSATIEALSTIIETLHSQGYEFVTLPEMTRMGQLATQSWFV